MQIYATMDSKTGAVYVGQHKNDLSSYLGSGRVIKSIIKNGGRGRLTKFILWTGETDSSSLDLLERLYISHFKSIGLKLYNLNAGGKSCIQNTPQESRKKKAEAGRRGGRKNLGKTWWTNGKVSSLAFDCPKGFHKGRTVTYKHTEEHKEKIRKSCAGMGKGIPKTEEHKRKIGLSHLNRDPEVNRRIGETLRNRRKSK